MARIRTIKPEFFTSEDIVLLSPLARLLYIALWCEADRDGRLEWKPRTLKLRYFPADDCDIDAICDELVGGGLVVLYGKGLAHIPTFSEHQHVNPRESESRLPPPDLAEVADTVTRRDASARVNSRFDAQGGREGKGRERKGVPPSADAVASQGEFSETQPVDLKAEIFGQCLQWLASKSGKDPQKLRPLVGRWIRDHGEAGVLQAFIRAQREGPVEPISWMTGSLTGMGARKSAIEEGLSKWLREKGSHDVSEFSEGDGEIVRGLPVPTAGTG